MLPLLVSLSADAKMCRLHFGVQIEAATCFQASGVIRSQMIHNVM